MRLLLFLFMLTFTTSSVCVAETMMMGGNGWSIGLLRNLAQMYEQENPHVEITVPDSVGSGGGIKAVITNRFELSVSARPLKEVEKNAGVIAIPFLRTPFVIAASFKTDEAITMTKAEIISTYTDPLKKWRDGSEIHHVLRTERETVTRIMSENFPGLAPVLKEKMKLRGSLVAYTDQEAMDLAERVKGAIVGTTLLAIQAEKRDLKPIIINNMMPSADNLQEGKWDMGVTLYVILKQEKRPEISKFVDFLHSEKVKRHVHSLGAFTLQ